MVSVQPILPLHPREICPVLPSAPALLFKAEAVEQELVVPPIRFHLDPALQVDPAAEELLAAHPGCEERSALSVQNSAADAAGGGKRLRRLSRRLEIKGTASYLAPALFHGRFLRILYENTPS